MRMHLLSSPIAKRNQSRSMDAPASIRGEDIDAHASIVLPNREAKSILQTALEGTRVVATESRAPSVAGANQRTRSGLIKKTHTFLVTVFPSDHDTIAGLNATRPIASKPSNKHGVGHKPCQPRWGGHRCTCIYCPPR